MPTSLWLGPQPGGRLLSYVPEDDESRARLEQLRLMPDLGRRLTPHSLPGRAVEPLAGRKEAAKAGH